MKATRQVTGPQRIRVVACVKCRALLRVGPGESQLGRCSLCSFAFIVDERAMSELVLPAAEVDELPVLDRLATPGGEGEGAGEATMIKGVPATVPPRETVHCMLVGESPRIRFELDKDQVVVGRVGADLTINDPDVSRRHCTFERSGGKVIVRDLKSTNGTLVNGVRVDVEVLRDGDRIKVGSTELKMVVTSEGQREKHAALFLDLGPGPTPQDVTQALESFRRFGLEALAEFRPDVILSPSTGRGMVIWHVDPLASADDRRRQSGTFLSAPAGLRAELASAPVPSGQPLRPLVGLVMGLAKREVVSGRAKYEGPLLQKAALAVKVAARDAVFLSDIESLEMLTGERGTESLARRLHQLGLRALPAGPGQPFVVVSSTEAIKEGMREAQRGGGRPLRAAASTIEGELLDVLEEKCRTELDAGVALAFSGSAKGTGGVLRKLAATGKAAAEEIKVKTRLYESVLRGTGMYLGKDDVHAWMELLAEVGRRYPDALKAERDRLREGGERTPDRAWDDLLALDDASLLGSSETAILFGAGLFRGQPLVGATLAQLGLQCSQALASSVPAKYEPVPLPILGSVYGILREASDVPTDLVDGRGLFELLALLSLAGVVHANADRALRRAQNLMDDEEVRQAQQAHRGPLEALRTGLGEMARLLAVLKLPEPTPTAERVPALFARYQLPCFDLLP